MKKLSLIILYSCLSIICFAKNGFLNQDSTTHLKETTWIDINAGLLLTTGVESSIDYLSGFSIDINYIDKNYSNYILKIGHHKGFDIIFSSNNYQSITEIDLMTGKTHYGLYGICGFSIGLGFSNGVRYTGLIKSGNGSGIFSFNFTTNYNSKPFSMICIPIELYSNFNIEKFGLGIKWESNINPYLPYTGLSLFIELNNARR